MSADLERSSACVSSAPVMQNLQGRGDFVDCLRHQGFAVSWFTIGRNLTQAICECDLPEGAHQDIIMIGIQVLALFAFAKSDSVNAGLRGSPGKKGHVGPGKKSHDLVEGLALCIRDLKGLQFRQGGECISVTDNPVAHLKQWQNLRANVE